MQRFSLKFLSWSYFSFLNRYFSYNIGGGGINIFSSLLELNDTYTDSTCWQFVTADKHTARVDDE